MFELRADSEPLQPQATIIRLLLSIYFISLKDLNAPSDP